MRWQGVLVVLGGGAWWRGQAVKCGGVVGCKRWKMGVAEVVLGRTDVIAAVRAERA